MASRHHSLDYSEVKDVTQLVQDFEEHNAVRVEFGFHVEKVGKSPSVVMSAEAFTLRSADAAPVPLASVRVCLFSTNLRHWGAAVTHVLYVLDAKLARNEMEGTEQNS